jgi:hypothetical protein
VESGEYDREWNNDLSKGPPNIKSIPRGDDLLGRNVNCQGETTQRA